MSVKILMASLENLLKNPHTVVTYIDGYPVKPSYEVVDAQAMADYFPEYELVYEFEIPSNHELVENQKYCVDAKAQFVCFSNEPTIWKKADHPSTVFEIVIIKPIGANDADEITIF